MKTQSKTQKASSRSQQRQVSDDRKCQFDPDRQLIEKLAKEFRRVSAKAAKAAEVSADSFGSSRARATTNSATWATYAESRERLRRRLIELGATEFITA